MTTAAAATGSSSTPAALIINGLESGITTQAVINALLERYQTPITDLTDQQKTLSAQMSGLRQINTDLQALLTASKAVSTQSSWGQATATSSSPSIATAIASSGAALGSLTFTVTQLAEANILASSKGVVSPLEQATTATSIIVATGLPSIGAAGLEAGSSLAFGTYTIDVTQASTGGSITGSAALASSTTIKKASGTRTRTPGNDKLTLNLTGSKTTLTIKTGTYSATGLVAQINSTAKSQGVAVTASLDDAGEIVLTTNNQGSSAVIQATTTTDTVLGALNLTSGQRSATGTAAIVTVDGYTTTLASLVAGGTAKIKVGAGADTTITAQLATSAGPTGSLLASGTAKFAYVSTGSKTLTALVSAINGTGLAVSASTVQVSTGDYILQVSAEKSGASGTVYVTSTVESAGSPLGALKSIQTSATAEINVGGANGYTVRSPTDSFTGLLKGTTVTATGLGETTITVTGDATGEATAVTAWVNAANTLLADIDTYTGYTSANKVAGPLLGNAVISDIRSQLLAMVATARGTSTLGDLRTAGVQLSQAGAITFTRDSFVAAFKATATEVKALFAQGGDFVAAKPTYSEAVSFLSATTTTPGGTYSVKINSWATEATVSGQKVRAGVVTTAETLTISQGADTVSYKTTAGESLATIVSSLNRAFATKGMGLRASAATTTLTLKASAYGSSSDFTVESTLPSGGRYRGVGLVATKTKIFAFTGKDITGTIGGVKATGTGSTLTAPDGLSIDVTPPSGAPTRVTLGTLVYSPGVAQRLVALSTDASNAETGSITESIASLTAESTLLDPQLARDTQMETEQRHVLISQFAKMESALGQLKNESSALSGEIAKL